MASSKRRDCLFCFCSLQWDGLQWSARCFQTWWRPCQSSDDGGCLEWCLCSRTWPGSWPLHYLRLVLRGSSLAGFMFVGNALALPVHDPDNPIAHYRSGLHGRLPLMSTWLGYAGASQMPATRWRQGGVVSSLVMPWDVQLVINVFKGAGGGCINMLWTALEERCCDQKMLLR